jgi:glycosyltransferase involved in cell wall biosynthesis
MPTDSGEGPMVAFVLPSLNGGGAERAVLNLHSQSRLSTRVLVERAEGDLRDDPMAADAIALEMPEGGGRARRILPMVRALRRLRPAVVVAVLSPLTAGLAGRLAGARVVFWLQNPPHFIPGAGRQLGLRGLASLTDAIAGATPGLCDEWSKAGAPAAKMTVLPNGLTLPARPPARRSSSSGSGSLRLLAMGRLVEQKRHDLLIQALATIRGSRPAELTILGHGELEGELRGLAGSLGLAPHVHFPGFAADPSAHLEAADVFVLASDYEGFGNVIVEALGSGLPVVCTDAPHGPAFIASDSPAVRLVPCGDPDAIARAVLETADDDDPQLALEAWRRAQAFSIERVTAHFERLIERVADREPPPQWPDRDTAGPAA